jgi:hypothetical protein
MNGQTTSTLTVDKLEPLAPRTITIVVTAPDVSQKTYTVTVTREAPSSNAKLAGLIVQRTNPLGCSPLNPYPLAPSFSPTTTVYFVSVGTAGSFCVAVSTESANATVTINGQPGTLRQIAINPPGSAPLVTILVTAQNLLTTETYYICINEGENCEFL